MPFRLDPIQPPKGPSDVRLITLNWAKMLRTGTILTDVTASRVASGITVSAADNDDSTTTLTVTGGTAGEDYDIDVTVTTDEGETLTVTVPVPVR